MEEERRLALTEEQIEKFEKLKKQYGGRVYAIIVPCDDEGADIAVGFVKKPDRTLLGLVLSQLTVNQIKAFEILLNSTWIEGDERILKDDDVFMSAMTSLNEMITIRQGVLKKS